MLSLGVIQRLRRQQWDYIQRKFQPEKLLNIMQIEYPKITPSTIRLYSKKVPTREAAKHYADRLKKIKRRNLCERVSIDLEKSISSQQDWYNASQSTTAALNQKVKEPRSLLFLKVQYKLVLSIKQEYFYKHKWHLCMICHCREILIIGNL